MRFWSVGPACRLAVSRGAASEADREVWDLCKEYVEALRRGVEGHSHYRLLEPLIAAAGRGTLKVATSRSDGSNRGWLRRA